MKTIRFRVCQVIGIISGITLVGGCPSDTTTFSSTASKKTSRPRQPSVQMAPTSVPNQHAINKAPQVALSHSPKPIAASFLTKSVNSKAPHLSDAIALSSTPTRREPRSTKHPLGWIPSLFFLGFALGIIRRVSMSLTSRNNYIHTNNHQDSESYSSDSSKSGDLSRGSRDKGGN